MKKMKRIIYAAAALLVLASCNKIEDLNINEKQPLEVPGYTLFANAQRNLADQLASTNVNRNVSRLYSQYWTETTYIDESNYDLTTRAIPDFEFRTMYRDVLRDLKEAKTVLATDPDASADEIKAMLAICDVHMVYAYQRLVDVFGDIPYSEALDADNVLPAYDNDATVYVNLLSTLNGAIADLNTVDVGSVFMADNIYHGDVASWMKFANTLKLKIGIHVSDVASMNPGAIISEALTAGVFTSAADNASFAYESASPNTNPLYIDLVASGRFDFVPANTIVDMMNGLADPRRDDYFEQNLGVDVYEGGVYGASNTYALFTHINPSIMEPSLPVLFLSHTEVQFYLAEAAAKGMGSGSASAYYEEGVRSSILFWGGDDLDADLYLLNPAVAYATAVGSELERIATQSWIASYNRGMEAWTTWRRLDAPAFNPPPGLAQTDIPVRFTYPVNEQTLNGANYTSAAAAMGGDFVQSPIFWDVD